MHTYNNYKGAEARGFMVEKKKCSNTWTETFTTLDLMFKLKLTTVLCCWAYKTKCIFSLFEQALHFIHVSAITVLPQYNHAMEDKWYLSETHVKIRYYYMPHL